MTDADHRKALLLAKIEAHRTIFQLELRLARASFDPIGSMLSLIAAVLPSLGGAPAGEEAGHAAEPDVAPPE